MTEANSHAPEPRGRGGERWDARPIQMWFSHFAGLLSLVLGRTHALEYETSWRQPVPLVARVSTVRHLLLSKTQSTFVAFSSIVWVAKHANRFKRLFIYDTKMHSLRFIKSLFLPNGTCCVLNWRYIYWPWCLWRSCHVCTCKRKVIIPHHIVMMGVCASVSYRQKDAARVCTRAFAGLTYRPHRSKRGRSDSLITFWWTIVWYDGGSGRGKTFIHWPLPPPVARNLVCQVVKFR